MPHSHTPSPVLAATAGSPSLWQRFFNQKQQGNTPPSAPEVKYHASAHAYMTNTPQAVWMRRDYTRFASEAYGKNVVAHRAIALIAEGAASVPLRVMHTLPEGGKRPNSDHPLAQLLARPNPMQSGEELLEALYTAYMIAGNAFLHAISPQGEAPKELHSLRPDRVSVIPSDGGVPAGYRYSLGNVAHDYPVDRLTGQSRILHLKRTNPLDDWMGLSPVEAAAYSIDQHNQASAWNQALLQNGARPSGALMVKANESGGNLSEQQYERLKAQMAEEFSGAINAGRPLLLEGGLEWKELSLSPKDMDFLDTKHAAARDIALAFGVPPQLLGIPGDNTYANLAEARLSLWEQTILPLVGRSVGALNNWLSPMFGNDLCIIADTNNVSALSVKRDKLWERANNADFLSEEEKRAMVGLA